ncbi:hypothetical protein MAPG_09745, partial [Magnaporthiopsis poae ATCC 64411]
RRRQSHGGHGGLRHRLVDGREALGQRPPPLEHRVGPVRLAPVGRRPPPRLGHERIQRRLEVQDGLAQRRQLVGLEGRVRRHVHVRAAAARLDHDEGRAQHVEDDLEVRRPGPVRRVHRGNQLKAV